MFFHSWQFVLFFVAIFVIYWRLGRVSQNWLLLIASYIFYGWWDWRFLTLIWLSTLIDFISACQMGRSTNQNIRRRWLLVSLITNLGLLFLFKYFDFFSAGLTDLLNLLGVNHEPLLIHLILPVGISFYTFQTLSYTIDVYRRQLKPTNNLLDFALFVAFFPQLVAGPIERASNLLPQVQRPRRLNSQLFWQGLWLFWWGLWLKVFIADGLSKTTVDLFSKAGHITNWQTMIAVTAFSWQIFADFAGYSSMARGLANLLGFNLMLNFNVPFWSQNVREFWRRWHISLSTWVMDYLYIPLGGSRLGPARTYLNLIIVMTIMGLWHGARYTYVLWGLYWGLLLAGYRWLSGRFKTQSNALNRVLTPHTIWYLNAALTFACFAFSMILFRSPDLTSALQMMHSLFVYHGPLNHQDLRTIIMVGSRLLPLVAVSALMYRHDDDLAILKQPYYLRAIIIAIMFYGLLFYSGGGEAFIYFAF